MKLSQILRRRFRPYIGDGPLDLNFDHPKEKQIICLVARIQNFESLVCRLTLRDLGELMDRYYAVIAEAVMAFQGDIQEFCGPTVIAHYGAFRPVDKAAVVAEANTVFRAGASLETAFGVRLGLGLCGGSVIYGRFGSPHRFTVTAFGSPVICADHLADEERALAICELLANQTPDTITTDPRISVHAHWNFGDRGAI